MLLDEDLKNIIFTPGEPTAQLKLLVIERFIYDKTKEEVSIKLPDTHETTMKMDIAYEKAKEHYTLMKNGGNL